MLLQNQMFHWCGIWPTPPKKVCFRHPQKRYGPDTPRYLGNTWGVRRHWPKLVRSQKPKYPQTPRAGMFLTPRDISKIPGVSGVTGQNLSEAKSQGIRGYLKHIKFQDFVFLVQMWYWSIPWLLASDKFWPVTPDTPGISEISRGIGPIPAQGVCGYFGFWLLTSFGR